MREDSVWGKAALLYVGRMSQLESMAALMATDDYGPGYY